MEKNQKMFGRVTAIILVVIICVASIQYSVLATETNVSLSEQPNENNPEYTLGTGLTEAEVYNSLMAMKEEYYEGKSWTDNDCYRWNGGIYSVGYGCAGFAFLMSDAAFGTLKARIHRDWSDVRVGDILRILDDTHSVIVLKRTGNIVTVAEGNYGKGYIHWGRELNLDDYSASDKNYVMTRWPKTGAIPVESVTITSKAVAISGIGKTATLSAVVSPANATNPDVRWRSNDLNVASVSNGVITSRGIGTTYVECRSTENPTIKETCVVRVYDEEKTKDFIKRLYSKCLGRTSDAAGVDYWVKQLVLNDGTGASVGAGFVFSKEYINKKTTDRQYIEMLYNVFMNRNSDESGMQYWLNCLEQGVSRAYIFKGFVSSAEYKTICDLYGIERGTYSCSEARDQNIGVTGYVTRLYTKALGRKAEVNGINYWTGMINNKKCAPVVAAESFINSEEFKKKNLSDTEYIKVLYRTFFDREYDDAGLKYWLGRLSKGDSRTTILREFAYSAEFKKIMERYGL